MNRRLFLKTLPSWPAGTAWVLGREAEAVRDLKRFRITRVTGFRHVARRPKLVGYNARLGVHGQQTSDHVLRIETDQGIEGIGQGYTKPDQARRLVGMTLDQLWRPGFGVVSPIGRADHALYDLIGKALNQPAWRLLGGEGPEWVPVYDGSIYFNDLLPQYRQQGVARLLREVEASLDAGHRAFKIKVGRGFKWMDRQAGFDRDVEVVRAIRMLLDEDVSLMADANNGFDLKTTLRWLDRVADTELFFIEEMFPENVDDNARLKEYLARRSWDILVADGESAGRIGHFDAFIDRELIDVLQPDIRGFGLTLQWQLSRRIGSKPGIRLAPHNWGSFLGVYMQLVLGRGIDNFLIAEQDISSGDLFDTSAFEFREGRMRVPDVPGCGLRLREDVYRARYARRAWTVP